MRPIYQSILGPPDGNCFAASAASILELPLERVPNFHQLPDRPWTDQWVGWLAPANLSLLCFSLEFDIPAGYSILSVNSPRFPEHGHAVVCWNGRIVHDPWPGGGPELYENPAAWRWRYILPVLDPTQPVRLDWLPAPDHVGYHVDVRGVPRVPFGGNRPGLKVRVPSVRPSVTLRAAS